MPKSKEFLKEAENRLENLVSDKHERTEDCFEKLHNKVHNYEITKLCFTSNGQEIVSYDQIKDVKIGRIDAANENYFDYCLAELKNVGIEQCKNLPTIKTTLEGKAADLKNAVVDAVHTLVGDKQETDNAQLHNDL